MTFRGSVTDLSSRQENSMQTASIVSTTTGRVPEHSPPEANARIRQQMEDRIALYAGAGREVIQRRLRELDHEWDIERTLEANAASVSLIGFALGATVSRKFLLLPAVVSGFLLQHAVQGWCPPLALFRRRGVRTAHEIEEERHALQALLDEPPRRASQTGRQELHQFASS
jgi:hypothetical protein